MSIKAEKRVIWAMILLYIAVFGSFTAVRHYNFQTQAWDMAIFEQSFWNTIHGKIMINSNEEMLGSPSHFGLHMSPGLLLLVPGYAVFPSPYYLLIVQTLALALGAWPLYLLAKRVLFKFNNKWPLIIAGAYLIYPALHWVNNFDFHELPFLVPLLLAAFYFIEIKKWWPAGIFLLLAASVKEDVILIVAFVGLYLLAKSVFSKTNAKNFSDKIKSIFTNWPADKKFGLAVVILAFAYFVIATNILMPAFGGGMGSLNRLERYSALGRGLPEIIKNLATNPMIFIKTAFGGAKLVYLFWLFAPIIFISLLSGWMLIILIPGLAENLLTAYFTQTSGLYHYDALLIPIIFAGAVYGLKFFLDRWQSKEKILKWIFLATITIAFLLRSPLSPFNFPTELFKNNPHWEIYRKIVEMIPDNVSVAAETHLVPHLTHRERAYMIGTEPAKVDIVIMDGADLSSFADEQTYQAYADGYMNTGDYNYSVIGDRYFILSKKGIKLNLSKI